MKKKSNHSVFLAFLAMTIGLPKSGLSQLNIRDAEPDAKSASDGLKWGRAINGVQFAIDLAPLEKQDLTNMDGVRLNVHVRNLSDQPIYMDENPGGLSRFYFYTLDNQAKQLDLNPDPNLASASRIGFILQPKKLIEDIMYLPLQWLRNANNTVYSTVIFSIVTNGTSTDHKPHEAVSQGIDVATINDMVKAMKSAASGETPMPAVNSTFPSSGTMPTTSDSPKSTAAVTLVSAPLKAAPSPPATSTSLNSVAKPISPLAQAESPFYTMPAFIAFGVLIVAAFFFRRRR